MHPAYGLLFKASHVGFTKARAQHPRRTSLSAHGRSAHCLQHTGNQELAVRAQQKSGSRSSSSREHDAAAVLCRIASASGVSSGASFFQQQRGQLQHLLGRRRYCNATYVTTVSTLASVATRAAMLITAADCRNSAAGDCARAARCDRNVVRGTRERTGVLVLRRAQAEPDPVLCRVRFVLVLPHQVVLERDGKQHQQHSQASHAEHDTAAQEEFSALLAASNASSVSANDACGTALKHAECAKIFNVCELGTPQGFCLESCTATITTNCTALLTADALRSAKTNFCGDSASSSKAKSSTSATVTALVGISDGGKCFEADYVGPKHTAWIVGFIIAVVFSFFASVGINLQKKALKQNELTAQEQSTEPTPVYRLPLWCLGFFLILAGSVLDFVAFGLAPQSLLAPLAALTLVWNMMLAPCFNKEKLGRKDIAATLVIFTGATIAVVFASHTSPSYNLSMLMELYRDPLTCVYFVVVFLCVALHYGLIQLVEKFSLTSKRHRMIQIGQPALWARVRLVAYSGLSGTMGGQSVLFAKSCAELLKAALHGDDCMKHFESYLLALALIGCLLCQIHYLNCGLVHYDALAVVPIYQAYWIITGVLGGVIYFQEIRSFSVHQALMFVLGIITTIFGVVLLSQRKPAHPPAHSKRKILERGFSFTSSSDGRSDSLKGHLPTVPEGPATAEGATEDDDAAGAATAASPMATINENESEMSTGEESDDDDGSGNAGDQSDQVSRHVIDNYLDMSATMCFTEILGGLGFQTAASQRGIFSRRPSSRITGSETSSSSRAPRRSVDDIEVGMPAATRQANPREKVTKRRSITFTSFQNAKKDDDESPPIV